MPHPDHVHLGSTRKSFSVHLGSSPTPALAHFDNDCVVLNHHHQLLGE